MSRRPDRPGPREPARWVCFEQKARAEGHAVVAGVDEAGRGPLAGPVVAAAVVLSAAGNPLDDPWWFGVDDSKRLSPKRREELHDLIRAKAAAVGVGEASPREIEGLNILRATLLAMSRAIDAISPPPSYLLVDGKTRIPVEIPQSTLVGGDGREASIAAASIIAKVTRDRLMIRYDREYPGFGFSLHKGYPTRLHREALQRLGPTPLHRRTFRGVA